MVLTWSVRGLRRAWARPWLALILWLVNLLAGAVVALPLVARLISRLPEAPEGDRLLSGFSVAVLHDLFEPDRGFLGAWVPVVVAAGILALAANALLAGGVLECLLGGDERSIGHRFGRGAGRFFGRFLRVGAVAAPVALASAALVAALFGRLGGSLEESRWDPAELMVRGIGVAVGALALVLVLIALDLTRVEIVRSDSRKVVRLFFRRLGAVLRRPWAPLGLWLVNTAVLAAILALYLVYRRFVPAAGSLGIAAMLVVQQLVVLSRAGLRVALWTGEAELAVARWPVISTLPVEPDGAGETPALENVEELLLPERIDGERAGEASEDRLAVASEVPPRDDSDAPVVGG